MTCTCQSCSRDWRPPEPLFDRTQRIAGDVGYRRDYHFNVEEIGGSVTIELRHWRPDADTGVMAWGSGGKRPIKPDATDSEIVRVLFAAALAYEEHEVREFFTYRGKRIMGPHISVEALMEVADRLDVRS
jgi:hypothetical protein